MIYNYATVPAFFNAIRQLVHGLGYRNMKYFQDDETRLVGLRHEKEIFCIKASTIRRYYNAIYEGNNAPAKEAQMYARDIRSILQEKKYAN
jgi:hypothetical protein